MKTPFWVLMGALAVSGCETHKVLPTAATRSAPALPPQAPKGLKGKIGYGLLATHYDRDGDGKYEECHRGNWTYYDRNGDGYVDLAIYDDELTTHIEVWDENFDGVMDWSMSTEGDFAPVHRLTHIHEPASRIFLDDKIQWVRSIPVGPVGWKDWSPPNTIGLK